jgi:hypothetical protein
VLQDRFGARLTAIAAGVALAAGYGGPAFAHTPAETFTAAGCAGAGNGVLNPSQTTLLTTLAAADVRHRVSAVSRVAGNAGIGIGGALGRLVAAHGLTGFMALFLANAVSYLAYVAVLAAVVPPEPAAGAGPGRVLGDAPGRGLPPSRGGGRGDDRGRRGGLPDQASRPAAAATRSDRAAGMNSASRRPMPEAAAPITTGPPSSPV